MQSEPQLNSQRLPAPISEARPEDLDFALDCKAAFLEEKMPYANILLLTVVGILAAFAVWAYQSRVSEIAKGPGKIVPIDSIQIVQSLEGGIIAELMAHEGQRVHQDQVIAKLDDTILLSSYRENLVERDNLVAKISRLDAELFGKSSIDFPGDLAASRPNLTASETLLFQTRRQSRAQNEARLQKSLALKAKELSITRPLAESGIVSQVELLRLETAVNELEGQIEREKSEFLNEVVSDNNEYRTSLSQIEQTILAYEEKIARTQVRAPVSGVVNKVAIKTIGGVVQPGAPIMEIVPTGDKLLVEAKISPSDIAFVRVGQDATVKLTAYDYAIYGGLDGVVTQISADTFMDETDGSSYYKAIIRTGERSLNSGSETFDVLPGMIAQVDIKTGKKSILDYLMKPLLRAKMNAFTER